MKRALTTRARPMNEYWLHEDGASYGFWTAASAREAIELLRADIAARPGAYGGTIAISRVKAERVTR